MRETMTERMPESMDANQNRAIAAVVLALVAIVLGYGLIVGLATRPQIDHTTIDSTTLDRTLADESASASHELGADATTQPRGARVEKEQPSRHTRATDAWIVRGIVQSKDGPRADVPLIAELFAGYGTDGAAIHRDELTSEASGALHWALPPPEGAVTLRIRSGSEEWHVRTLTHVVPPGRAAPTDLKIEADPLDGTLRGQVLDLDDRPIVDARVRRFGGEIEPTDTEGRFSFPVPRSWSRVNIWAYADGHVPGYENVVLDKVSSTTEVTLRLKPGRRIHGVVQTPDGRAIAGAEIMLQASMADTCTSDAYGKWELTSLEVGARQCLLIARSQDFATSTVLVEGDALDAEIPIIMSVGLEVDGFVETVDEGGRRTRVPGAKVTLAAPFIQGREQQYTDDRGRFRFQRVSEPEFTPWPRDKLTVEHEGHARNERDLDLKKPESLRGIRVVLATGHRVAGRVTDESDRPIEGVRIHISSGLTFYSTKQQTTADGSFALENLAPREIQLAFFKRGYKGRQGVEVTPGTDSEALEIRLMTAGYACGTVIDAATDEPIESFRIREVRPLLNAGEKEGTSLGFADGSGTQFTTTDGVWRSKYPAQPGSIFGIEVRANGYAIGLDRRVVASIEQDPKQSVLRLQRAGRIVGLVLDSNGDAVAAARVRLLIEADLRNYVDSSAKNRRFARTSVQDITDSRGAYTLDMIPATRAWIEARHERFGRKRVGPFQVPTGGESRVEIRLPSSAVLTGRVLGLDGKPLADFEVGLSYVESEDYEPDWTTKTDEAGVYRFDEGLSAGRYHLRRGWAEKRMRMVHLDRFLTLREAQARTFDLAPDGLAAIVVEVPALRTRKNEHIVLSRLDAAGQRDPGFARQWYGVKEGRCELLGLGAGLYRVSYRGKAGEGHVDVKLDGTRRATASLLVRAPRSK